MMKDLGGNGYTRVMEAPDRLNCVWPLDENTTKYVLETIFQRSFVVHPFVMEHFGQDRFDIRRKRDPLLQGYPHLQLEMFCNLKNFTGTQEFVSQFLGGNLTYRLQFVNHLEDRFSPHGSFEANAMAWRFPSGDREFADKIWQKIEATEHGDKEVYRNNYSIEASTFKYFFREMLHTMIGRYRIVSAAFQERHRVFDTVRGLPRSFAFADLFRMLTEYVYLSSFPYFVKGEQPWGQWYVRTFMHEFPWVASEMPALLSLVRGRGKDKDLYLVNPDLTGEEALALDPEGLSSTDVRELVTRVGSQKLGEFFGGCFLYASKLDHPFVSEVPFDNREPKEETGYKLHIMRFEDLPEVPVNYFDDYLDGYTPAENVYGKLKFTDEEQVVMDGDNVYVKNVIDRALLWDNFEKWLVGVKPFHRLSQAAISTLYSAI